ncbi:MAG: LPS-assembly protein LptD [Lentisphaerae bacterium]|nr:LPS-assembly protein LptD [Lentisphaerota bacterium]
MAAMSDGYGGNGARGRRRPVYIITATVILGLAPCVRGAEEAVREPPRPRDEAAGPAPGAAPREAPATQTVGPAAAPKPMPDRPGPIETRADQLDYDRKTGWIEGRGNVMIRKGDDVLTADYVRVNVRTEDAHAYGSVILRRKDEVWRGDQLNYNFRERTGDAAGLRGDTGPYVLDAARSERGPEGTFTFHKARLTTCTNAVDRWHYHVTARKVRLQPGQYMKVYGAVWRLGGVPVMYVPYWYRNLREDVGFRLYAGHSSRMGTFVLSSYRYRVSPMLKAETHLDYRTERGVGVGQDFDWRDPEENAWFGKLQMYYIDDKEPLDEDEDPATSDIDNERYRFKLEHEVNFTYRDYALIQAEYLSDTDILEDFFEDDYRDGAVPDNYATYTHRGDYNSLTVLAQGRLNDFYGGVNRVPEVSMDLLRQPLGSTRFYYEGQTAGAYLERVYPDTEAADAYSSVRLDTDHTLYRPSKLFGFLTVIPRAGYRGTYYSDTRRTVTETRTQSTTETNLVVDAGGVTNPVVTVLTDSETFTREEDAGSDFRNRFELGVETSYKAFKVFQGPKGERRHIAEPYANYTYVPEPNLVPGDLYDFDAVDALDEEHFVRVGMRNKWQRKRKDEPFDIADVNVYTRYRFEREDDEDAIDRVFLDAEFQPNDWMQIDTDAEYDVEESRLDIFNTRLLMGYGNALDAEIEYRYRYDESSLLRNDLTFYLNRNWSLNTYGRYEFEESRLEEQGGYLQRSFDCMVFRAGASMLPGYTATDGTEFDDEFRFLFEFWMTAFPDVSFAGRHRN